MEISKLRPAPPDPDRRSNVPERRTRPARREPPPDTEREEDAVAGDPAHQIDLTA